jgi:hypothetical protein
MNKTIKQTVIGLGIVGAMALTGCGGGGGGDNSTPASVDTTPPVVTLKGEQRVSFEEWKGEYEELGATAVDNQDGDVTEHVLISGEVGTQPNVYTITYYVYDNALNRGFAERYVTVTPAPEDINKTQIDALMVFTDEVNVLYAGDEETRLTHLLEVTNQIFSSSRTGVVFNLVGMKQYEGISKVGALNKILEIGTDDKTIAQWRDEARADEVLLYGTSENGGNAGSGIVCGTGWVNVSTNPRYAFASISTECSTDVTAHEIGHTMGNQHSHIQGETGTGIYPYSLGHLIEGNFGTVMTYAELYGAERKYIFSSPDLLCNSEPCGIEEGEVGEADVSRSIRETKQTVSNFR